MPLASLSFAAFARIWLLLLTAGFWLYAWSLARLFQSSRPSFSSLAVWGLVLALCPGSYRALALGQVDPLLWMCGGLALAGIMRPALWSLAALVKIFYLWPFVVWASRSADWREFGRKLSPGIGSYRCRIDAGRAFLQHQFILDMGFQSTAHLKRGELQCR